VVHLLIMVGLVRDVLREKVVLGPSFFIWSFWEHLKVISTLQLDGVDRVILSLMHPLLKRHRLGTALIMVVLLLLVLLGEDLGLKEHLGLSRAGRHDWARGRDWKRTHDSHLLLSRVILVSKAPSYVLMMVSVRRRVEDLIKDDCLFFLLLLQLLEHLLL
jgi:hypothetical protein